MSHPAPAAVHVTSGSDEEPWCVNHTPEGCLGREVTIAPGITVWATGHGGAPTTVVIDHVDGTVEVPVVASADTAALLEALRR